MMHKYVFRFYHGFFYCSRATARRGCLHDDKFPTFQGSEQGWKGILSHSQHTRILTCRLPRRSAGHQLPTPSSSTNFAPPSGTQKRSVGWRRHHHRAHYRVRPHRPARAHQHQGRAEGMRPLDTWIARPVIRATNTNAISNG